MAGPNDLRFPSIDALRAFEAAARLGSFERAAEELAVTASAVSKRVATLEDLLGAALLFRGGRALTPTPHGKEYLGQVRAALGLLATVPLHQRAGQRLRRLRVSAPPTFARQILVPALEGYTAAHPEIELEVVLSIPYLDELGAIDAEVAVRHGDAGALGVPALTDDLLVPLASRAVIDRLGPARSAADLARYPLLRTPLEPWTEWFVAAGLAWAEPVTGPRLVDLGLVLEAAVCGQGVALARPSLARSWLDSGALAPVLPICAATPRQYYLSADAADPDARGFAQWLGIICTEAVRRGREALSRLSGQP